LPGTCQQTKQYNKLFDTLVKPIILYGSEIWGTEAVTRMQNADSRKIFDMADNDIYEKLHNKFCKLTLQVGRNTTHCACKGELGRFPLIIDIHIRIVNYWHYLGNITQGKELLRDAVKCSKSLQTNGTISLHKYGNDVFKTFDLNLHTLPTTKLTPNCVHHMRTYIQKSYLTYYDDKLQNSEKLLYYKQMTRPYTTLILLKTETLDGP
jgi:hypothetical protein